MERFWNEEVANSSDAIRCHMFYGKRLLDIPDGLPKWSGMSGKSDLIEDSPPEEVKKRKREIEEEAKEERKEKVTKKK